MPNKVDKVSINPNQLTEAMADLQVKLTENAQVLEQLDELAKKLGMSGHDGMTRKALKDKKELLAKKEALEKVVTALELRGRYERAVSEITAEEHSLLEGIFGGRADLSSAFDADEEVAVSEEAEVGDQEVVPEETGAAGGVDQPSVAPGFSEAYDMSFQKMIRELTDEMFEGKPAFSIKSQYLKEYAGLMGSELYIIENEAYVADGRAFLLKEGEVVVALKKSGSWTVSRVKKEALIERGEAEAEFGIEQSGRGVYRQVSGPEFEPQGPAYKLPEGAGGNSAYHVERNVYIVEEGHKDYEALSGVLKPSDEQVMIAGFVRWREWVFTKVRREKLKLEDGSDLYEEDRTSTLSDPEVLTPEGKEVETEDKGAEIIDATPVLPENEEAEPVEDADSEVYRDEAGKLHTRKKEKPTIVLSNEIEKLIAEGVEPLVIGHDHLADYPGLAGHDLYIYERTEKNKKEYDVLADSLRLNHGTNEGEVIAMMKKEKGAGFVVVKREALVDQETFDIEDLYIQEETGSAEEGASAEPELPTPAEESGPEPEEPTEAIVTVDEAEGGFSLFREERVDSLLPTPPQLPDDETIADYKYKNQALTPQVQVALDTLNQMVPEMGFDGLTPDEVMAVSSHMGAMEKLDRSELWKELIDFANEIVMASHSYMEGAIPEKMVRLAKEILKRDREGKEYNPTDNSLQTMSAATILVCTKLLSRSIDHTLLDDKFLLERVSRKAGVHSDLDVHHINPLVAIALRKVQDVVTQRTMVVRAEELHRAYADMVGFHTEMVLKLDVNDRKLQEFFGEEDLREMVSSIGFLRRLISYWYAYGRMTPKQQKVGIEVYQGYRQTVQFMLNATPELVKIIQSRLDRKRGDPLMAQKELLLRTDDSSKTTKGFEIGVNNQDKQFIAINRILEVLDQDNYHEGTVKLNKHNFLKYPYSIAALKRYFGLTDEEKNTLKKQFEEADDHKLRAAAKMFFEIMDQYLEEEQQEKEVVNS